MKRLTALLLSAVMALCLFGCGSSESAAPSSSDTPAAAEEDAGAEEEAAAPAEASGDVFQWRMASMLTTQDPMYQPVLDTLEKIKERTDGHVIIDFYPDSQLGDYTAAFGEVMRGTIEMYQMTPASQYDPTVDLLALPYLPTDYESAKRIYSEGNKFYAMMDEVYSNLNTHLIGFFPDGFHSLGFAKDPGDYLDFATNNDLLMRVPPAEVYQLEGESFGYRTSAIAWNDVYTSLQTGIVDGYIGCSTRYCYTSFGDQTKYLIRTNDVLEAQALCCNKDKWNELPEEYQNIITEEMLALIDLTYEEMEAIEDEYLEKIANDYGCVVVEPSSEELETLAEKIRAGVWPTVLANYDKDTMNEIFADIGIDYTVE